MIFPPDSSVLVVFCKRPQPGVGKQRVAAERGEDSALELSRLLLSTTFEDVFHWDGPVVIAPAAAEDEAWAQKLLRRAKVVAQEGANLGERINHVDRLLRAAGAVNILYIGTDAPCLSPARLEQAAAQLDTDDVVLAPARDGGVILMGSSKAWPDLGRLPWETDQLCAALADCCSDSVVKQLEPGEDIDYWDDVQRALPSLWQDPREWRQFLADWATRQQSISIVVPVLGDTPALRELLDSLNKLISPQDEIIVVDGGEADECRQVVMHHDACYVTSEPCRGLQLDTGARAASGDILWFLHADSQPPEAGAESIRQHVARGASGGYFGFRFLGRPTWYKRFLQAAINSRSEWGTPYGDQGLFMKKEAYCAAGGFAHEPLFEEVALVKALRAQGRFTRLNVNIGVSPRRWERDGWLRRTLHNRMLAIAHRLGVQPTTLAQRY